ncbi:MAG TPA: site-2 protease family protein [Thermoanaerobaculia bacterium]|nr:site-2 protease family protein [Thermoanaerobaculia bacterium]
MFGNTLTLFRLAGFEVRIDLTWLIIFALIVWSLASGAFPDAYPGLSRTAYWSMGFAGAAALFLSIILHELAHAAVARRYGVQVRSITLFIFGGVADLHEEPPSARAEMRMAVAGPATSLALAIVLLIAAAAGRASGVLPPLWTVIGFLGGMNGALFLFNMLPAFPLDGGRVLRAWLWKRSGDIRAATRTAATAGNVLGMLLMALGVVTLVMGHLITGFWWILIGFFIRSAGQVSYHQIFIRETLAGERVRRFMTANPVTVPRVISVKELVEKYVFKYHHKLYPVMEEDKVVGCVTMQAIRDLPSDEWERQTVGSIAEPCSPENTISPDEEAMEALARMSRDRRSRLLVMRDGTLEGVVTLSDLLKFLSLKMEFEKAKRSEG